MREFSGLLFVWVEQTEEGLAEATEASDSGLGYLMIIPKMQPDCHYLNEGLALFGSSASEWAPVCATSEFPLNTSHALLLSSLKKTEPTCTTAVKCSRHFPLSVQMSLCMIAAMVQPVSTEPHPLKIFSFVFFRQC